MNDYKYIYPPTARTQDQLDVMLKAEAENRDPLALENIDQEKQAIIIVGKHWFAAENRYPREGSEQHLLIIAKDPMYDVADITPEAWTELYDIWTKLIEKQGLTGAAFCMRFGDPARSGASLKRLHVNVIMPKKDEKVRFPIGGRAVLKEGLHL